MEKKRKQHNPNNNTFSKLKSGIAIGSLVVGGLSGAYKGETPTAADMVAGHQRSQDLQRRGNGNKSLSRDIPGKTSQLPEEKTLARRRIMDQMRSKRTKDKELEKQRGKAKEIGD